MKVKFCSENLWVAMMKLKLFSEHTAACACLLSYLLSCFQISHRFQSLNESIPLAANRIQAYFCSNVHKDNEIAHQIWDDLNGLHSESQDSELIQRSKKLLH